MTEPSDMISVELADVFNAEHDNSSEEFEVVDTSEIDSIVAPMMFHILMLTKTGWNRLISLF